MGIRQKWSMGFPLVEHFVKEMFDVELNSFDNAQTGTVINWNVLEIDSIPPTIENVRFRTLDTNGDLVSVHEIVSTAGFAIYLQNNVSATQPSFREGSSSIQVFTGH